MTKHLFAVAALFTGFTGFAATPALAAELDFRSSAFAPADQDPSFQYVASDGVTLTVTAGPAPYARLYQDSTDGFGVRYSYETDEIEGRESLTLSFSETVLISDVFLTDLFVERSLLGNTYAEIGYYSANSSTTQFHAVQGTNSNGELTIHPSIWADAIVFTSPGLVGFQNHEYSVAGLNYSTRTREVPELDPSSAGSAVLLVVGAALMLSNRRRALLV